MRKKESNKNTILILGASGFIGNVLYKELLSYFDVYGTYCQNTDFKDNPSILKPSTSPKHRLWDFGTLN